ncbi:hypothetical protein, partial [Bifidobacterium thermacidophilum]
SVTLTGPITVITSTYGTVTGVRAGRMIELYFDWKSASTDSWATGYFGTLPEGWRPLMQAVCPWHGRDGSSQRRIVVEPFGAMYYTNVGGAQNPDRFTGTIHFIAS